MDPASLAQVESLCDIFYTNQASPEWASAQQQILMLQSSADHIPQCQYILDNSKNAYALLLAATALTKLITGHWNNFSVPQHIEIRNYILDYLARNGPNLQDFVSKSLIQLVCRLTKLGWFDDQQHREIVQEVSKFLEASINHCVIGLRILNNLVDELNIPITGRTLTQHRKTAVSFRDQSLLDIFNAAFRVLQQLQMNAVHGDPEQEKAMGEQALSLVVKCLSFDFIGTNPDDSSEDVNTIQVPSAWRSVMQDTATMNILIEFYNNTEPPRSSSAMQALILLSSVRRSLFRTDKERSQFLGQMMTSVRDILHSQQGLQHKENYHEFCRLLGRLKSNYQLSELVRTQSYLEWLSLAAEFSVKSFENWQWSSNSIHYLLQLWGRLVAAVPYVHPEANGTQNHMQQLEVCTQSVLKAYIKAMIDSVQLVAMNDGTIEDPLDSEGSLKEQLDRLPLIFRFQYHQMVGFLIEQLDPLIQKYQDFLHQQFQLFPQPVAALDGQYVAILEGQLTWMMYIIGAIIGGLSWNTGPAHEGEEKLDAEIARRAFQLAQLNTEWLKHTQGRDKCDSRLELAILFFFQHFRKVYMVDGQGSSVTSLHASLLIGGGAPYEQNANRTSMKQKATAEMFEAMGLGAQPQMVEFMVTKIVNNLKYWADAEEVLSGTLALFLEVSSGGSGKTLLNLDDIQHLIENHTPEHLPFLVHPQNYKQRTALHATLARLIFHQSVDNLQDTFNRFMKPTLDLLDMLNATPELRNGEVRQAFIGVCRDLRGVAQATNNKRAYSMLFEMLYPKCFPVFTRAAEAFFDDPDVITSLLKFLQEFVNNKAQRVNFDNNSPNGILLFRETSSILVAYGSRILHHPVVQASNVYKERYKGIALTLLTMTVALTGNYVNFGVFALYEDKALENALEVALQLIMSVGLEDVLSFPKLSRHYFSFLDVLFRNHLPFVAAKDTGTFMTLMTVLHEGLQALDPPMSTHCASAIDYLASYLFINRDKDWQSLQMLNAHVAQDSTLFPSLTSTLFTQLLFGPYSNHWSVTRPMLSLMMADEQSFTSYRDHLISTQSPENQQKLNEAFAKLLTDVQRNLEPTNRDRFAQHLATFRQAVRGFLTY